MLVLALLLILVGCVIAATVERTIGILVAVGGVIVLVFALVDFDADAAVMAWSSWSA